MRTLGPLARNMWTLPSSDLLKHYWVHKEASKAIKKGGIRGEKKDKELKWE